MIFAVVDLSGKHGLVGGIANAQSIAVAMVLSSAASSQCAQAECETRIVGRDDRCRDPVPVHRHPALSDETLEATHGWIDTGISHMSALRHIAR